MSTPPNKILEILKKKKEDITKDDKKVIKRMTIEEAEGAFGPQVRGSVETRGTGQYQYQYKTAPSKYLYKDGQLQLGPDNKPLINPLYRTGKLGSVVSAASLALQGVGPQADPFSKLGAIIAGSLAPIFMKGIGADIKYYRATEQIKQENKEAMATSQASARADSTGLQAQKSAWKFKFDQDMGRIKLVGANAKLESEQLEASKFAYDKFMQMALSNPFGDDEEVSSFLKGKGDTLKRELLNRMGYNDQDIESSGGLGAFNDAVLIGAKAKDFGNIKIYETSNGIPLGPVYVKGQLVPSAKYAATLQEVIGKENGGVDLSDVGEAWRRATDFVDKNSDIKAALSKLSGKAREQQRLGLIKSYANEVVKRAKAGDTRNKAISIDGKPISADEMFTGFTIGKKPTETPKSSTNVVPAAVKGDTSNVKVTSPLALRYTNDKNDSETQLMSEFTEQGDKALDDRIASESDPNNQKILNQFKARKTAIKNQYTSAPIISAPPSYTSPEFFSYTKNLNKYINWYETITGGNIPVSEQALSEDKIPFYKAYKKAVQDRATSTTKFLSQNNLAASDYTVNGQMFYTPVEARNIGAKGNAMMVSLKPLSLLSNESEDNNEYRPMLETAQTIFNGAILAGTNKNTRRQQLESALQNNQALVNSTLNIESAMYDTLRKNGRYVLPIPNDAQRRQFYFVLDNNELEVYLAKIPK